MGQRSSWISCSADRIAELDRLGVTVCVTGHWLVGHFAHREGDQSFIVEGAAVQGYNVRMAGPTLAGS